MNEIDLLSHVYQTAEMGQDGITSVLKRSRDPSLNQALERQKREYHDLQASAGNMLRARVQQPDGTYTRELAQEPLINSQEYFYEQAYEALEKAEAEEETADADSNSTKN